MVDQVRAWIQVGASSGVRREFTAFFAPKLSPAFLPVSVSFILLSNKEKPLTLFIHSFAKVLAIFDLRFDSLSSFCTQRISRLFDFRLLHGAISLNLSPSDH